MLLTRMYDYGWCEVPGDDLRAMPLEEAVKELFGASRPVLYRVRLKIHTSHLRAKVRRSVYQKARAWHRVLARRAGREPGWAKTEKRLAEYPTRGPKGRARQLMLAKGRLIYGSEV